MKWPNALVVVAAFGLLAWIAHLIDGCGRAEDAERRKDQAQWQQFKVDHHCRLDTDHMAWNLIWHCDGVDVIRNGGW